MNNPDVIKSPTTPAVSAPVSGSDDAGRLNHLELHLASGGSVNYYLSTEGHCYKLADKYDYRVPYHRTLRQAVDASRQNNQAEARGTKTL